VLKGKIGSDFESESEFLMVKEYVKVKNFASRNIEL
jgi:hypothetical protein